MLQHDLVLILILPFFLYIYFVVMKLNLYVIFLCELVKR